MVITRTALGRNGFRGGIDVRVSLRHDAGVANDSAFDGAWWPRGHDLTIELPELIAELGRRGVRVERFTYSLAAWEAIPRKIAVLGRVVRTGGFRSMDAQVVSISWEGGDRRGGPLLGPPGSGGVTRAPPLRPGAPPGVPRPPPPGLAPARGPPPPP